MLDVFSIMATGSKTMVLRLPEWQTHLACTRTARYPAPTNPCQTSATQVLSPWHHCGLPCAHGTTASHHSHWAITCVHRIARPSASQSWVVVLWLLLWVAYGTGRWFYVSSDQFGELGKVYAVLGREEDRTCLSILILEQFLATDASRQDGRMVVYESRWLISTAQLVPHTDSSLIVAKASNALGKLFSHSLTHSLNHYPTTEWLTATTDVIIEDPLGQRFERCACEQPRRQTWAELAYRVEWR